MWCFDLCTVYIIEKFNQVNEHIPHLTDFKNHLNPSEKLIS
jgi:hypothetical protein